MDERAVRGSIEGGAGNVNDVVARKGWAAIELTHAVEWWRRLRRRVLGERTIEIYRAMSESSGMPAIGPTARTLGVRPGMDIPELDEGDVLPVGRAKGMSVAPHDPMFLVAHRRPATLGGVGRDPVWMIESDDLGSELAFHQDKPTHGVVAPAQSMTLREFQDALARTQGKWSRL